MKEKDEETTELTPVDPNTMEYTKKVSDEIKESVKKEKIETEKPELKEEELSNKEVESETKEIKESEKTAESVKILNNSITKEDNNFLDQPKKSKTPLIAIIIVLLIVIGLIIFFVTGLKKDSRKYVLDNLKELREGTKKLVEPINIITLDSDKLTLTNSINSEGSYLKLNGKLVEDTEFNNILSKKFEYEMIYSKKDKKIQGLFNILEGNTNLFNGEILVDENKVYGKLKDVLEQYIILTENFNIFEEAETNPDFEYIVDKIIESMPKQIDKKDFKITTETIEIDKKEMKVEKHELKLDEKTLNKIINGVIKDLKNDSKALEILEATYPNFKDLEPKIEFEQDTDSINYILYVSKGKVVKTELDFEITRTDEYDYQETLELLVSIEKGKNTTLSIETGGVVIQIGYREIKDGYQLIVGMKNSGLTVEFLTLEITGDKNTTKTTIKPSEFVSATLAAELEFEYTTTTTKEGQKINNDAQMVITYKTKAVSEALEAKIVVNAKGEQVAQAEFKDTDTKGAIDYNELTVEQQTKIENYFDYLINQILGLDNLIEGL